MELNQEVPVQACLQPLIAIPQMISFNHQTVQNMDNGLVEDVEDYKNRDREWYRLVIRWRKMERRMKGRFQS